ncbi:metallophosphoesterase [Bradyrhizobium japonicum]|uniref:metallophosphoesterase n=1 Tax=Bradyrhizobium japonicum TaxID=375 RepID=UPI0027AA6F3A|nr:metallophosphoesterase [Bradyrhizobium japonicum]
MKLFIASDLHGEAWSHDYTVPEGLDFDVAVFAGDVHNAYRAVSWISNQRALWGKPILFVAGNHEYYGSVLQDAAAVIRDAARRTNVTFLDADAVPVIGGVRFLGCTMWTDYRFDAESQAHGLHAGKWINDHKMIRTSGGAEFPAAFTPLEALKRHTTERRWLTERLAEEHDGPTVVVTHHAPHPRSLHERYAEDGAINASSSAISPTSSRSISHPSGSTATCTTRSIMRSERPASSAIPTATPGSQTHSSFLISSSRFRSGLRARLGARNSRLHPPAAQESMRRLRVDLAELRLEQRVRDDQRLHRREHVAAARLDRLSGRDL